MPTINTDKLVAGLTTYFQTPEIAAGVASLKADFSSRALFVLCGECVERVELLADDLAAAGDTVTGKEKLNAVKKWLDDVIDLPGLLEWADDIAINALVGSYVAWYNHKHGHDWVKKLKGAL